MVVIIHGICSYGIKTSLFAQGTILNSAYEYTHIAFNYFHCIAHKYLQVTDLNEWTAELYFLVFGGLQMNALPVSARHVLVLTAGPRGVSQYFSYSSSKYILLVEAVKKF